MKLIHIYILISHCTFDCTCNIYTIKVYSCCLITQTKCNDRMGGLYESKVTATSKEASFTPYAEFIICGFMSYT